MADYQAHRAGLGRHRQHSHLLHRPGRYRKAAAELIIRAPRSNSATTPHNRARYGHVQPGCCIGRNQELHLTMTGSALGNLCVDRVSRLGHLIKHAHVHLVFRRQLVNLGPFPNRFEVAAPVLRVEVDKRHRLGVARRLPPYLSEHSDVGDAHELLAQNVQAVGDVESDNLLAVLEGSLSQLFVVVVVPLEHPAKEVLALLASPLKYVSLFGECSLPSNANDGALPRSQGIRPRTLVPP